MRQCSSCGRGAVIRILVTVVKFYGDFTAVNATKIMPGTDLCASCADDFEARGALRGWRN